MDGIGVPQKWERLGETKWYRVETSTKKVYYYNRASKESRWERPDVGVPEPPEEAEPPAEEPAAPASASARDVADYKGLLRELKLPDSATFDSALPRLLYDERFKRIPQAQRRQLFVQLRRELLKESSRSLQEISKEYLGAEAKVESAVASVEDGSLADSVEAKLKPPKGVITRDNGDNKRAVADAEETGRSRTRQRTMEHARSREELAADMARTAFLSLLHEKVKMPFSEGELEPLDEALIAGDPRGESQFLRDRDRVYLEFAAEFLEARLALFEQKLRELGSDHLDAPLKEVVHTLGDRLFANLPWERLEACLRRWRRDTKTELLDAFDRLLRQTLCYAEGTAEENLRRAKQQLRDDIRYQRLKGMPAERDELVLRRIRELEDLHRNSKGEFAE